jgi:hypothetical protein
MLINWGEAVVFQHREAKHARLLFDGSFAFDYENTC